MPYLTASLEDYLEAILELSNINKAVKSIDIATKLGVSRASVNKAVNLLKEEGYITHAYYSDIFLTESGYAIACRIDETHKTLNYFFTSVLGVSKETASIDACKVEHNLSAETLEKLNTYLKNLKDHRL